MAIKRVWHGWTTPENADKYQNLLHNEVFPGIEAKKIPGYQSIELLRRMDVERQWLESNLKTACVLGGINLDNHIFQ